jgi:hypothetical protein
MLLKLVPAFVLILPLCAIQPVKEFPDSLESFTKNGCEVKKVTEPEGNVSWHVSVWTDGALRLPRWQHLYSVRERRSQSLQDCDKWMGDMEKKHAEFLKKK